MNPSVVELDARRLLCPLPVIRLQNIVKNLAKDTVIQVICTDPGTRHDIPTWCRLNGHQVQSIVDKINDTIEEIHFFVQVT